MPYGYAGGPVVAEAMQDLYAVDSFNYPAGYPLALLAATIGMFVGVITGGCRRETQSCDPLRMRFFFARREPMWTMLGACIGNMCGEEMDALGWSPG